MNQEDSAEFDRKLYQLLHIAEANGDSCRDLAPSSCLIVCDLLPRLLELYELHTEEAHRRHGPRVWVIFQAEYWVLKAPNAELSNTSYDDLSDYRGSSDGGSYDEEYDRGEHDIDWDALEMAGSYVDEEEVASELEEAKTSDGCEPASPYMCDSHQRGDHPDEELAEFDEEDAFSEAVCQVRGIPCSSIEHVGSRVQVTSVDGSGGQASEVGFPKPRPGEVLRVLEPGTDPPQSVTPSEPYVL